MPRVKVFVEFDHADEDAHVVIEDVRELADRWLREAVDLAADEALAFAYIDGEPVGLEGA